MTTTRPSARRMTPAAEAVRAAAERRPSVTSLLRTVVEHKPGHGWTVEIAGSITDDQALEITFRADPAQVVLGDFVEVVDHDGTRIGHVAAATYHERIAGPAYVIVAIELR